MFPIKDNRIREFCRDVLDVDYILYDIGRSSAKRTIVSEQQYIELELLYGFNDAAKNKGLEPYVQILLDDSGARYAKLSAEGTEHAFNNDFSFIPECRNRDSKNVSLRKAYKKMVDDSLEEKICEKCGNVLGVDMSEAEYLGEVNRLINRDIEYPAPGVFLKTRDFPRYFFN